jgi:hypothetical protein
VAIGEDDSRPTRDACASFACPCLVRFAGLVDDDSRADAAQEVLSLCRALRDAQGLLGLTGSAQADLLDRVERAESAAAAPIDRDSMDAQVRAIRYLLVEVADGPISAFMADAAARIIGDGIGRLFS